MVVSNEKGTASVDRVDAIRSRLLLEQPKLDTAIKSFASYLLARSSSSSSSSSDHWDTTTSTKNTTLLPMNAVLAMSRKFSLHINQHVFTVSPSRSFKDIKASVISHDDNQVIAEVTAQVWNELVAMKQKPTKSLGRTALMAAWNDLELPQALLLPEENENEEWNAHVQEYVRLFHELLLMATTTTTTTVTADARLIWDTDKGQAELARRAANRNIRAAELVRREQQQQGVTASTTTTFSIEEWPPDE